MTRDEFELMIEPIRLSSIDLMTPPPVEAYTEALREVRRRERAREIREHLKEVRESHRHDPANFYHGRAAFMYVVGNPPHSEVIRYEQSTHGDEAGA